MVGLKPLQLIRERDTGAAPRPDAMTAPDLRWQRDAACVDAEPELFYADQSTDPSTVSAARRICRGCSVRRACVDYAIENNEQSGMWGGLTANERRSVASRGR